ncbi:MAG: hypothetical protein KDA89_21720 [Planctomycetaceae bacterium]|nr:hypothetical protein [Planctomycetaceae bacterium]
MPQTKVSLECDDISYGWYAAGTQILVALITGLLSAWIAFGIIISLVLGLTVESWRKGTKDGSLH